MAFKFTIKPTINALKKTPNVYREVGEKSLRRRGQAIMREARVEVPRDRGVLANSGFMTTKMVAGSIRLILAFTASYAVFVHEGFAHHASPTKRKFLEDPIKRAAARMRGDLAADFKRLLPREIR